MATAVDDLRSAAEVLTAVDPASLGDGESVLERV
jgi:hypothetical protein